MGIGDVSGLRLWIEWAARHDVGFIQLLPINECGADYSPYSAISSVALEPSYLALDEENLPWVPEKEIARARERVKDAKAKVGVDYATVRRVKRNLLEIAWQEYSQSGDTDDLQVFREQEKSWLDDYCVFRFLMEQYGDGKTWDEWPVTCQTPQGARGQLRKLRDSNAELVDSRLGFFAFVQMLCFNQWRALRAYADQAGVKLMGDVPIGVSRHSCDVFFKREEFRLDWCGGSPAEGGNGDPFISQWGQNWGIPLYRWDVMEANGFRWWRQRMERMKEFFSIIRLDHVLGFYRIYAFPWLPRDNAKFIGQSHEQAAALTGGRLPQWSLRPDDGMENEAANRRDGDLRLRGILGGLDGVDIIAEDLGWVPEYVRPHLADLEIAGFKIPHWDCNEWGHPTPGNCYSEQSFATYSTHDHDPINGIWNWASGIVRQHRSGHWHGDGWALHGAYSTLKILADFAGIPEPSDGAWWDYTDGVRARLIKALLDSNSRFACFAVQEIFSVPGRINHGGTQGEGNWVWRTPWNAEALGENDALHKAGRIFANLISLSNRANSHHMLLAR